MILLDTCTLIWLADKQEQLSKTALLAIKKSKGALYISAISAFEIAIKVEKKKMELPQETLDWYIAALKLHGIKELPLTSEILINAAQLPKHHFDPADRIIIATAERNNLNIITPDTHIKKYTNVQVMW